MNSNITTRINEIVSSGSASPELLELLSQLDETQQAKGVNAIAVYAIGNDLVEMLSLLMSNGMTRKRIDTNALWESACERDEPGVVDTLVITLEDKAQIIDSLRIALKQNAAYSISMLQRHLDVSDISKVIRSDIINCELEVIKGLDCYPHLYTCEHDEWIKVWRCLREHTFSSAKSSVIAVLNDWLGYQSNEIKNSLWNAAITYSAMTYSHGWIMRAMKDAGFEPSVDPSHRVLNLFVEDGNLEVFSLLNGAVNISNSEEYQEALSNLVQQPKKQAFITHLCRHALSPSKNFFCKLISMPYDRLELRKVNRELRREPSLMVHGVDGNSYMQIAYVALMIDKFGIEAFCQHAIFDWHLDKIIELGYMPMDVMPFLKSSKLKSNALQMLSSMQ